MEINIIGKHRYNLRLVGEIDLANSVIKAAFGGRFSKESPLISSVIEEALKTLVDFNINNGFEDLGTTNELLNEFSLRLAFKLIPSNKTNAVGEKILEPSVELILDSAKKAARGEILKELNEKDQ